MKHSVNKQIKGKTMKNKLLLSTALIGSIVVADLALAQTTVTGNLAINYRAQENKTAAAGEAGNTRGFGRESQINIQNKGKLNNGMDYAAGFSLEFDGNNRAPNVIGATGMANDREANTISNENLYVNFIKGTTTFHIGVDHIQNISTDVTPMVLPLMDNVAAGIGAKATNTVGANPKEAFGFGIIQAIPGSGITASALYVPRNADFGNGDHTTPANCLNTASTEANIIATADVTTGCRNSAYEIGLVGADAFGIKGLGFRAFKNKEDAQTSAVADLEGDHYGISYRTGAFAVGVERYKQNRTAGTTVVSKDQKSVQYGVTYAVNNNVSVGLVRADTDVDVASSKEEKITSAQIGYNLGPVALSAAVSKVDDRGASTTAGTDSKEIQFRITTAF
jgi:hypothetical protein